MYYDRVLSTAEALYVSRAKQKIAELTVALVEEYSRNDIDDYKVQLSIELQLSIEVLESSTLTWTADEIQGMTDYYSIEGNLVSFGFVGLEYTPVAGGGTPGVGVYATIPQLNAVEQASIDEDIVISDNLIAEIADRIAGDSTLQDQLDLLGAGGALTVEITSQVSLGSIYIGQVFPIGTLLQDIWDLALTASGTVDLSTFTFDSYVPAAEVGSTLTITQFTWETTGVPAGMTITDSEGVLIAQAVTGNSYTPAVPLEYPLSVYGPITWTLSATNMEDIVITVNVWDKSYYNKESTADDTAVTVTQAKILARVSDFQDTTEQVTMNVDTTAGQQGFIAVPKIQTAGDYTKWVEFGANSSIIAVGDFIRPPVDVLVNGIIYSVYRWGYRSPLVSTLTLYR
jgi:hypothetical protein